MHMLETVMAFAVTMIIFSTITTGIVEAILRRLGRRERNLENTIRSLYQSVIVPWYAKVRERCADGQSGAGLQEGEDRFVESMVGTPIQNLSPVRGPFDAIGMWISDRFIIKLLNPFGRESAQVDHLSVVAFAERLGRTDVGQKILAQTQDQMNLLVTDLARSFERFGRASGEIYRKNAQTVALFVGVVFAFGANIDVSLLFTSLQKNAELRTSLVTQGEDAKADFDIAAAKLELVVEAIQDEATNELNEEAIASIKDDIDALHNDIKEIESIGLPIGWRYFPYCRKPVANQPPDVEWVDPRCDPAEIEQQGRFHYGRWAVFTLLAGILIGLGGPFWYRVYTSLSQLFQLLRAFGIGRTEQAEKAEGKAEGSNPAASIAPESVIDAFEKSARAHAATL